MSAAGRAEGTSSSRRWAPVAALVVGSVIGVASGASIHYQSSIGGLGGALSAGFAFLGLAAIAGVSGVVALIAALVHRSGVSIVVAAFAGGLVLGGLAGSLVGPTYREPTTATGSVKVVLTEPTVSEWSGRVTCTSVANGSVIAGVDVWAATRPGRTGSGRRRATRGRTVVQRRRRRLWGGVPTRRRL